MPVPAMDVPSRMKDRARNCSVRTWETDQMSMCTPPLSERRWQYVLRAVALVTGLLCVRCGGPDRDAAAQDSRTRPRLQAICAHQCEMARSVARRIQCSAVHPACEEACLIVFPRESLRCLSEVESFDACTRSRGMGDFACTDGHVTLNENACRPASEALTRCQETKARAPAPSPAEVARDAARWPPSLPSIPTSLRCTGAEPLMLDPAARRRGEAEAFAPIAGQMTEPAAQAKRLFDSGRYADALGPLADVMNGVTGDDPGGRQRATLQFARSLVELRRSREAHDLLRATLRLPYSSMRTRALLTLLRAYAADAALVDVSDLVMCRPEDIEEYRLKHLPTYAALSFFIGRERYAEGDYAAARTLLAAVDAQSPYRAAAEECAQAASRRSNDRAWMSQVTKLREQAGLR
jgi:hypothetical protein